MKKLVLAILAIFILTMIFSDSPSSDLQVRIQNNTDQDIFRLWLGRAEHPQRYFFRGDKSVVYEDIDQGQISDYESVHNTYVGLARIELNTIDANKKNKRYRVIRGLINNRLASPSASENREAEVLKPGKYTLKIMGFYNDSDQRNLARYILIKD